MGCVSCWGYCPLAIFYEDGESCVDSCEVLFVGMMLQHCFRFGITVHVQVYPDLCVEVIYGFINVVISPPACSNAVECHYVGMAPVVFIAFRVCQFVGCTGNHHSDGLLVLRNFSVCQQAVSGIYFDAIRSLKNEIAGGKRADKAARTWNQAVYFECVAFACIKSCCTAGGSDCFLLIEYYIVCGIAALYLSFFLGAMMARKVLLSILQAFTPFMVTCRAFVSGAQVVDWLR